MLPTCVPISKLPYNIRTMLVNVIGNQTSPSLEIPQNICPISWYNLSLITSLKIKVFLHSHDQNILCYNQISNALMMKNAQRTLKHTVYSYEMTFQNRSWSENRVTYNVHTDMMLVAATLCKIFAFLAGTNFGPRHIN